MSMFQHSEVFTSFRLARPFKNNNKPLVTDIKLLSILNGHHLETVQAMLHINKISRDFAPKIQFSKFC